MPLRAGFPGIFLDQENLLLNAGPWVSKTAESLEVVPPRMLAIPPNSCRARVMPFLKKPKTA